MPTLPKILIATASAPWRAHCRETLAPLAAGLLEAGDAPGALQAARCDDLALVLLDVMLPGQSGFEVAAALRADEVTATTPLIFIGNGAFDAALMREGYRAGAVDCLNIADDPEVLAQKARVFLELRRAAWHQATRDALTGLPNRALFVDRLEQNLGQAARARRRFALGFMDLDGFKDVNDRHGHAAGDELLLRVTTRLRRALRETDTVARIGGDEFALLFRDVDADSGCRSLCDKIHRAICEPVTLEATLDGAPVRLTPRASIGIALYPDHAADSGALLRRADASMYAAKRSGGGVCVCGARPA